MQRIGTADGRFVDGDPFNQVQGTPVRAAWLYAVQEELAAVAQATGAILDPDSNNQVLAAIETLIEARSGNYALDTGSVVNKYVVALAPAVTAYQDGLSVRFRTVRGNTGAATLDAGAGPAPLRREDGVDLAVGDIGSESITTASYVVSKGAFLVTETVFSQLGALARLNIGAGLYPDGYGNLAVGGPIYLAAATAIQAGKYLVDTSAGGFALTLPATPAKGAVLTFSDGNNSWGTHNWTLARNGKTIMGQTNDLVVNVSDQQFSIWFNGSDWRLY